MAPTRRKATVFPYRGKWRLQYVDFLGKQRTLTAASEQEAFLKLAELEGSLRSGFLNPDRSALPSFGQWLEYWLTLRKSELNPTTWHGYESSVRNWLKPTLGLFRIDSVTAAHIQQLYAHLMQQEKLKPNTIRKIHSLLSSAFSIAVQQGVIQRNPLLGVRQPKFERKQIAVLTTAEVSSILSHASKQAPEAYLRWVLALRYGLRQGEALGLKFSDFDLVNATVRIQRTVNSLPNLGVVELPTKSANSKRVIPLDAEVVELVRQLPRGTWLFPSAKGGALDATVDARRWRKLLKECGITYLPLHSARHTVATHLIEAGVSPRMVQLLLGHSSPAYTLATYVHPSIEGLRTALEFGRVAYPLLKKGP